MLKRSLCSLLPVSTSHGVGEKRVLLANGETDTAVTQIAITHLKKGEQVALHIHATMEEYFYFLKGEVNLTVNGKACLCRTGDFIQVLAGVEHSLEVLEDVEVMTMGCAIFQK